MAAEQSSAKDGAYVSRVFVREWSEQDFSNAREAWTSLLKDSDAHPLFMSWFWQWAWASRFVPGSTHAIRIAAAYADADRLIGLAPMRLGLQWIKGCFPTRRLTFLAGDCDVLDGMMSEYLSFVLRRGYEDVAAEALARTCLEWGHWDDAWFDLVLSRSATLEALRLQGKGRGTAYDSPGGQMASYRIATGGNFDAYERGLGSGTRRRLFGLRRRLISEHGSPLLEYAAPESIEEFLDQLNALHALRWGQSAFADSCRAFVLDVCRERAQAGGLALSRLIIEGATRSVLLNVRAGCVECNLQAGFDASFDRKLPLGYLHLGYAIEEAFRNPRIEMLDLLVGRGKNSNYKAALATHEAELNAYHLVKHPVLRVAYRVWRSRIARRR